MYKICPKCGERYGKLSNYCRKCGVDLHKDINRCSEPKTRYCESSQFPDDAIYCEYCGARTTYAQETQN